MTQKKISGRRPAGTTRWRRNIGKMCVLGEVTFETVSNLQGPQVEMMGNGSPFCVSRYFVIPHGVNILHRPRYFLLGIWTFSRLMKL